MKYTSLIMFFFRICNGEVDDESFEGINFVIEYLAK